MSEMIKEFKKGDLLHIDKDGKAQWGFPEGYPYKEGGLVDPVTIICGSSDSYDLINGIFYKVSDIVLSDEEIKNTTVAWYKSGGDTVTYALSERWEEAVSMGLVREQGCMIVKDQSEIPLLICVRDTSVFSDMGMEFPETGLYLGQTHYGHVTEINIPERYAETTHPISPEFLSSATTTTLGAVKQMPYLPDAESDAPTAENFNQLLRQLKNAGLMK